MTATNLIMAGIVLFLAGMLLAGAKYRPDGAHFFDRESSGALRGFWSLIVVLVHIPAAYQNRLQDMMGSLAYVGVTFFFLTSAYGLRSAARKRPDSLRFFWRKRLPKLLLPCLLTNVVRMAAHAAGGVSVRAVSLVRINHWVLWLLMCYLFFWLCFRFLPERYRDWAVCGLVTAFSLAVYAANRGGATWCPEVFGFAWGILLCRWKDRFLGWADKNWLPKTAILCLTCGILGLGYLKCKDIPVFGDYVLKIVLAAAILWFMLALNGKISIGNRVSRCLGNVSYEVFLLHDTAFYLLERFLPGLNSGGFILLSLLVTVLLSWITQKAAQSLVFDKLQR